MLIFGAIESRKVDLAETRDEACRFFADQPRVTVVKTGMSKRWRKGGMIGFI
jgi:hypothetical protein